MDLTNILKIRVNVSDGYDVTIGRNIMRYSGEIIKEVLPTCKIALITDDRVDRLYSDTVKNSLEKVGYTVMKYVFLNGESSKNIKTYTEILNFLAQNGLTRTDAIVALGGGVVGDMSGFAAATYLRGIKYVQIPTTLLAQIDSSVGGKTAIDLEQGKNLVGAFCQPIAVICDVEVLTTLPYDVFSDGMGEAVKYAFLDKRVYELITAEEKYLEKLVYHCIDYKRDVVEKDEFESGLRKLLNLGHTVGHGIERLSEYTISHGKAVAMGLNVILDASLKHGYIDEQLHKDLKQAVENCVGKQNNPYAINDICKAAFSDKKRSGNNITVVMIHGVNDCRFHTINIEELTEYLS